MVEEANLMRILEGDSRRNASKEEEVSAEIEPKGIDEAEKMKVAEQLMKLQSLISFMFFLPDLIHMFLVKKN